MPFFLWGSMFDHEKFEVYKRGIQFIVLANKVSGELPEGNGYLVDQLRRASSSILLNIAEGAGEYASSEKGTFYRMAKRSATECAGIQDVCKNLELIGEDPYKGLREMLVEIVSMLIKMAKMAELGRGREKKS